MGRRAYMNRLALGRSPYEAPDPADAGQGRVSAIHADGYVQQYDERGHPINPASKAFGRELRRAKNDILSTMGIVVSGEDGSLGISKEKQKVNLIAAENDYGLVMATLDQIFMFLGSWWVTSLGGRILTFKSYTCAPLMSIIRFERKTVGLFGFYFAGIPAWATSFSLSIFRSHLLETLIVFLQNQFLYLSDNDLYSRAVRKVFSLINTASRATLFALFGQVYMFSLLQSLHLVHPWSIPGLRFFIPFSESSLIRLPPLPTDYSLRALGSFGLSLLTAPYTLIYLYVYLRPIIEARIYRLLRRRLPKPDRPDELSIRVAIENDLLEWTVPTLGRRADEEARRSSFTLLEEIKYELLTLRNWALSWFGWKQGKASDGEVIAPTREERIESLRHRIEQLQQELSATPARTHPAPPRPTDSLQARGEQLLSGRVEGARPGSPGPTVSTQTPDPGSLFNVDQVLPNEEGRLVQSPLEMNTEYFDGTSQLGRTGIDGIPRPTPSTFDAPRQSTDPEIHTHDDSIVHHRSSRSNTLFSRPSSPESSPFTSPRVRASLVHQSSDVITMQLELLTSNRNPPNTQHQTGRDAGHNAGGSRQNGTTTDQSSINRTASELLDALLSNQGQNLTAALNSVNSGASGGLSALTTGASPATVDNTVAVSQDQTPRLTTGDPASDATPVPGRDHRSANINVLPDAVEEPADNTQNNNPNNADSDSDDEDDDGDDEDESEYSTDSEPRPVTSTTSQTQTQTTNTHHTGHTRQRSTAASALPSHRVTILSSHPVDSLSSHLASLISTILFAPLESMYLRSLAISYLSRSSASSSSAASVAALLSDVRRLGSWPALGGDGGGVRGALAYVSKLVLVLGMQAAVSAGVWGVGTGVAISVGKRGFGWGNL